MIAPSAPVAVSIPGDDAHQQKALSAGAHKVVSLPPLDEAKHIPCRFFFAEGCKYGKECAFSHGVPGVAGSPEIEPHPSVALANNPVPVVVMSQQANGLQSSVISIPTAGPRLATQIQYPVSLGSSVKMPLSPPPNAQSQALACAFFNSPIRCKNGDACPYAHYLADGSDARLLQKNLVSSAEQTGGSTRRKNGHKHQNRQNRSSNGRRGDATQNGASQSRKTVQKVPTFDEFPELSTSVKASRRSSESSDSTKNNSSAPSTALGSFAAVAARSNAHESSSASESLK